MARHYEGLPDTFDGLLDERDQRELRALEVAANEAVCTSCWLVHPRGSECP